jgi:hypothetical protein
MIRYSLSDMQADKRRLPIGIIAALAVAFTLISVQAQETGELARVPTSYANIHDAPSTASNLLLLVPEGTELPILGRQGEWVQVQLSPELRETGMIIRWYEGRHEIVRRGQRITIGGDETGWMHDSTVEIVSGGTP